MNKKDLKQECKDYLKWLESENYCEDHLSDMENNIFIAAMIYCCGENVFDRINAALDIQDER